VWQDAVVTTLLTSKGCQTSTLSAVAVNNPSTSDDDLRLIGQAYARAGGKLPFVMLIATDGSVVWSGQPTTGAALVAALTPLFGKD